MSSYERLVKIVYSYLGWTVFCLSIVGLVGYVYFRQVNFIQSPTYLDVVKVFGSIALSAALFALYGRMSTIQSNQTGIQDTQTQIMDAQLRPVVEVQDISATDDRLEVKLKNMGNGIARNLRVSVHILCYNSNTGSNFYCPPSNRADKLESKYGSIGQLPAGESTNLTAQIHTRSITNPDLDRLLGASLSSLVSQTDGGYDQTYYQIEIRYDQHMTEGPESTFLPPARAPLGSQPDMESLLINGESVRGEFSFYADQDEYGFQPPGDH